MAKNEQQGIDKIQCGRIDFYIPLIFETKCSFENICSKINKRLDKDITAHYSTIQQNTQDFLSDSFLYNKNR